MAFETGPQTQYTPDGQRTYNQSGELVTHHGYFETLANQTATFTRASTAYKQDGSQVAAGVPRYEYARQPAPVWQDTFDTDQLSEYTSGGDTPATWTVSGGVLTGAGWRWATQVKNNLLLQDVEIEISSDQVADSGIVARYQDSNNYYWLCLDDDSASIPTKNLRLHKRVNGVYVYEMAFADVTWARSTSHLIKFTLHGSRLEAYFDGVKVISVTDTTFSGGGVGLLVNNSTPFRVLDFAVFQVQQFVMVEESTTNLLTANQASVESDTTGFGFFEQTLISRDTANHWHGSASLKVVTPGAAANEGFYTVATTGLTASQPYTASAWLKGSGTVTLRIREWDSSGAIIGDTHSNVITLTNAWKRYSVSRTFGSTGVQSQLLVRTNTTQAITFYADGLQIERKAYVTSWQLPSSARTNEVLTVPTAEVMKKTGWTVEFVFISTSTVSSGYKWIWSVDFGGGTRNEYGILLTPTETIRGEGFKDGSSWGVNGPAVVVGQPCFISFSHDGDKARFCVNGIQYGGDISASEPTGTMPINMYLGCKGSAYANGIISNFRISNRARTLAEHQAAYATGLPLPVDEYTTYLMSMNGTLQPTIRGFGLWSKNGRHILHDPQSGQGIEVWDDNSLKVLIGLLANGKIGIKANDGEIYSGKFQTGNENSNTYIALNSDTLSAFYNGKQKLDMWGGNWGNIVFFEDGNRVGQIYTINESDPLLGGTKKRFVVWSRGDGSLRLDGPGIELDSDNVKLARSSSSQISVRGKIWDDLLPAYDLGGFVGRDGSRWHTVRARYITSGDLCFEEESCPICEQPFTLGDTIVLTVHHIHEEHHTMCIPIHETCKDTRKTLTVEVPETEKRYRLGKDGQIETYHATKFKEVEEQMHKIKDDYSMDEKTGQFKKKAVAQPAMKDEAVEIVTVKRRVPVMKTVKVELNAPMNT